MNYLKKYLKYKKKYLDLKLQQGGDNNCGVNPDYGSSELNKIAQKWNEKRAVSWSSGQEGYYLMHEKKTINHCTDYNNHIHIINAYINNYTGEFNLNFSQKIAGYHINIPEEMYNYVRTIMTNPDKVNEYLKAYNTHIGLDKIMTSGYNNNKEYKGKTYNADSGYAYIYVHSLIGDKIKQMIDSGQLT
jgi:hypothetical protein